MRFFLHMFNLKTSTHEYAMKAPTSREACEFPPDINVKLHASQSYSETRFVHILQEIYHQRYVYCVTFYCVFIR